jgi:hypothetical protein
MAGEGEGEDWRGEIRSNALLVCVVSRSFADVMTAMSAVDVEWHLEADDEDAFRSQAAGASTEGMTVVIRVERSLTWTQQETGEEARRS